eukprot:COSAG02_NODE_1413_length_12752_cov_4.305777_15_plen_49_part_00
MTLELYFHRLQPLRLTPMAHRYQLGGLRTTSFVLHRVVYDCLRTPTTW